jgi:peroxiredoxin
MVCGPALRATGWSLISSVMETLRVGNRFPQLQARAVDGTTLRLPDELQGITAVLLFYRGHW